MPIPDAGDAWTGKVNEVTIGATKAQGGTRGRTVTVGGARVMPFAGDRKLRGRRPVIACDVFDVPPEDWPKPLADAYRDVWDDPAAWAKKCVEQFKADLVCVKLDGTHPDGANRSPEEAAEVVRKVLAAVDAPVIAWGCEVAEKDNKVMPKVSEALKGENALIGIITKENYKTTTAVALADGHGLIALAPIDVNIAKQVNILASDMGFPLDRIVIYQTTGALGYGLEYDYSIHERQRLAALAGDRMLAQPALSDVGTESWRSKEAKAADAPGLGPQDERGPMWEAITAISLLASGTDILRMNHPKVIAVVRDYLDRAWG